MVVALAGTPWERPWRRLPRVTRDPIRRVRDVLRRIELHGPQEPYRAQLVRAVRSLLAQDPGDGPFTPLPAA